uniref:Metalloendopeptidase-like membrane protein n=1 Tax=Desulfovibrio sp. U5L TaxID=596152 RepID=I2PWY2_9BACT
MRGEDQKRWRVSQTLGRYALGLCLAVLTVSLAEPALAAKTGISPAAGKTGKAKKSHKRVSSGFGTRSDPLGKSKKFHKGLDITGQAGLPVLALREGTVVFAGWKGAYGRMVDIDHGNGVKTRYAHLRSLAVKRGDRVGKGYVVGTLGRTGRTTGNNLHFEVRVNDKPANPDNHLTDASALLRRGSRGG